MSAMRETMWTQPEQLARLLADTGPAEAAAARLKGRRLLLVGIGTSWHAAQHGAWMLREVGAETLHISGIGNGGELETVAAEASYAYTASHTGAMARPLEHRHRVARASGVAEDDHADLGRDRAAVRRDVRGVHGLGIDAGLAQHPRAVVRGVPARPDADEQQPAPLQPGRGRFSRAG